MNLKSKTGKFATVMALALGILMALPCSISTSSAMTVLDPSNLVQGIIGVIQRVIALLNQISQVANQVTQIAHLYSMVVSWISALQSMDLDVLMSLIQGFLAEFGITFELLDACNGLLAAINNLENSIDKMFEALKNEDPVSSEEYRKAVAAWNNYLFDTAADGIKALEVLKYIEVDGRQLNTLMSQVESSEGQTSAIQSSAAVTGLVSKQLGRLSFLLGHMLSVQSAGLSVDAAKELQAQKQIEMWRKSYTEFTDTAKLITTGSDGWSPKMK